MGAFLGWASNGAWVWHVGWCLPASLSSAGGGCGGGPLGGSRRGYGSFLAWGWPFSGRAGACGMYPKSRGRRARLPRFIILVSFSDTLLVVSILDICGRFCSPEGIKWVFYWIKDMERNLPTFSRIWLKEKTNGNFRVEGSFLSKKTGILSKYFPNEGIQARTSSCKKLIPPKMGTKLSS